MLMLSNVLALALIVADEPRPAPPPVTVTGHLQGRVTGVGSADLPAADEPDFPSAMPKIVRPRTGGEQKADEVWQMTLPEAIRIGLDNSEIIRVISLGVPNIPVGGFEPISSKDVDGVEPPKSPGIVIAPLNRDASAWKFKAEVMAHVRSIEQQYWALAHQHVVVSSRETAVRLGRDILRRERDHLGVGLGTRADVAEAEQQLENYHLNLVSAVSDLIAAEKQLRNLLGLPPADNRRIVPATPPTEARLEPDWEVSLREMMESQPDVAQQAALVRLTELQLIVARNQILPLLGMSELHEFKELGPLLDSVPVVTGFAELIERDAARPYPAGMDPAKPREPEFIEHQVGLKVQKEEPAEPRSKPGETNPTPWQPGGTFSMPIGFRAPLANTRQAQYYLLRQRATQRQIVHQATHSLARFFLEVDANYKQFRTAQRLRAAAQQRLEAQRIFYEEGRITLDRLLDAVTQYSNAIAQESLYKSTYNTSIAALEEAKGTLLAYDHITVAEPPAGRKAEPRANDPQVAAASFDKPAPAPQAEPAAMTYKLKASLGGAKFLEIEFEVKQAPPDR